MEGLKECRYCKEEIKQNAKVCPNCNRTQANPIIIFISLMAVAIIAILGISYINNSIDNTSYIINQNISNNNDLITLSQFEKVQTGMTYEEVVNILGSQGELLSETDIGYEEYFSQMYQWYGVGILGANANFIFQGGKLTSKSQYGLE